MKRRTCPFSVGDTVCFTPSERTLGQYQDPGRFGVEPGDEVVIREIRDDTYLYFDDGAGGWPWTEFSLVRGRDE